MIKIFLKFAGYILLKWVCFYIYELAESGFKWNPKVNKEGYLLGAFMLLALPIIEIIVLILPIHLALKQKGWLMIVILILTFALEFFLSWYTTNQQIRVWMIVKMTLSIGLFCYLYRNELIKN